MSSVDNAQPKLSLPTHSNPVLAVVSDLANLDIQDHNPSPVPQDDPHSPHNNSDPRPFIMYSRSQLLLLHKSPLVHLPSAMPALKDWFGTEIEQLNAKKDSEATVPVGNTRDRRFRRDAEDSASARQSFRGAAITQPSQMGNFKHQSIRATDRDRDRDRDTDKDQDRDKVKEGQERLRNLSDKYDRDRRALSSISQMRTKDRELAPHLANATSKVTSQGHQSTASRTGDSKDPQRKKEGESDEDWRRDQPRTGRERPENGGRRDRDDRERPRSRVRDSSRPRRDGSPSRRDKDDRRMDRDDGYGGYRRDRDDRDRDLDRDSELEDPRRWRDDGKRDERVAARREREIRERDRRDRPAWDGSERSDRRWVAGEDRDSRGKRPAGRERKAGEESKDRDDRKDREKEPAWMDTYIPSSGGGIIGGQRHSGELDGIQAFRKEMQQKDKSTSPVAAESHAQASSSTQPPENQLDEIQLFRLMMKREEQKKKTDSPAVPRHDSPGNTGHNGAASEERAPQEASASYTPGSSSEGVSHMPSPRECGEAFVASTASADAPAIIASGSSPQPVAPAALVGQGPDSPDKLKPPSSRLLSTVYSSDLPSIAKPSIDTTTPSANVPQSHPPAGSRLLALGSRTPQNATGPSIRPAPSQSPVSFGQKNGSVGLNTAGTNLNSSVEIPSHLAPVVENLRVNNGFYPFDEHRAPPPHPTQSDAIHRGPLAFANDRAIFGADHALAAEPGLGGSFSSSHAAQPFEPVGSGIAAAKGSRFAKFFDSKGRDNQPAAFGKSAMGAPGLSQPGLSQKMDAPGLHPPHNPEARAMEDIFAMLNNSVQAQRLNVAPELSNLDVGYNTPSHNLHGVHTPQGLPHLLGQGRLDSLYDDRNFVPDGMVPGLRSVPPPRSRQGSAMYSDFPDEPIQFNNNQRAPTQVYPGPVPSLHLQHGNVGRGGPISMQAAQFRGGPSPNHPASVQRLPLGLANLGGRPPHEPNQFVNTSVGMANGGLHGTVHGNGPPFNNFQQPALGFGSGPQMRAPHPGTHQLPGALGPNPLQGLVHPGNLGSNQAQLLGLAGANGIHGGLRGPGGFGQQGPQVQPPHIAMRQHQQPQQQIPPHMLPLHLQQQGFGGGATNQPTHDLMALLMNGARRD